MFPICVSWSWFPNRQVDTQPLDHVLRQVNSTSIIALLTKVLVFRADPCLLALPFFAFDMLQLYPTLNSHVTAERHLEQLCPPIQLLEHPLVIRGREIRDWLTKSWKTKSGRPKGGRPFDRGNLHALLKNPLYIGKLKHKKNLYVGEHDLIVQPDVFQKVQTLLLRNRHSGSSKSRNRHGALLKRLLYCKACGHAMVHNFTGRGGKLTTPQFMFQVE